MATIRPYDHERDFDRVGKFLVDGYRPGPTLDLWLQPRWEYMFSHPYVDEIPLSAIGVAVEGDAIVGVVHPEHRMAFGYFQIPPDRPDLVPDLLDWAEAHLGGWSISLERDVLGLWINDDAEELRAAALERGFALEPRFAEPHAQRSTAGLPEAPLPDGYRLQSLADENDLEKINAVLWRGFDHGGEPDPAAVADRRRGQLTAGFRHDLTIVAVAPDGSYASYAGIWVVPENRVAYVEPVATDPAHRRMGLGRACVLETIRRAAKEGAETAWVGSDQDFYLSFGFEVTCRTSLYVGPWGPRG